MKKKTLMSLISFFVTSCSQSNDSSSEVKAAADDNAKEIKGTKAAGEICLNPETAITYVRDRLEKGTEKDLCFRDSSMSDIALLKEYLEASNLAEDADLNEKSQTNEVSPDSFYVR